VERILENCEKCGYEYFSPFPTMFSITVFLVNIQDCVVRVWDMVLKAELIILQSFN
jgi:hypothetical protein